MRKYVWKKGTSEQFSTLNPILGLDVIGYEIDTKYIKYGDGTSHWNDLQYINKPKSAYDIAVENGFIGSEAEWIASLKADSAYEKAVTLGYPGSEDEYYSGTITGVSKYSWGEF